MIEGIFWDNDGVLVDTEALYFRATAEVMRHRGFELSRTDFIEVALRRGTSAFALAEAGLTPAEMDELRLARDARYAELLAGGIEAMPGVEQTLAALHGRVRMAVVTSSKRAHFDLIHRRTGLLCYFDFVLTREDYRQPKPHPEAYLAALARAGLSPRHCLAVEDSERGVRSAAAAGLRCLALPGELTRDSDFSAAERILTGVSEVVDAVLGAERR
jgi:HAD superfamily hydrolase (TIGR01509 family)